jgi:hypothetical protein
MGGNQHIIYILITYVLFVFSPTKFFLIFSYEEKRRTHKVNKVSEYEKTNLLPLPFYFLVMIPSFFLLSINVHCSLLKKSHSFLGLLHLLF